MNLFLHGIEDFDIIRGDTLAHPAFTDGDRLRRFDVVLANPPYSIKSWDRGAWSADPWGRNRYGTPPQGRADYAFWQHILASLNRKSGRCAVLFPHGVLFRDEEREMRRKIVADDVVEAVIGLGPNLFYNSPMEACILVCRSQKPAERAGKVLLIDAVNEVTRERAQSFLTADHIARIVGAYRNFANERGYAAIATLDEIAKNDGNLSISLYVQRPNCEQEHDLDAAIIAWREGGIDLRQAAKDLFAVLDEGTA
jgi:type I restriction enzyme M protein